MLKDFSNRQFRDEDILYRRRQMRFYALALVYCNDREYSHLED